MIKSYSIQLIWTYNINFVIDIFQEQNSCEQQGKLENFFYQDVTHAVTLNCRSHDEDGGRHGADEDGEPEEAGDGRLLLA